MSDDFFINSIDLDQSSVELWPKHRLSTDFSI